jgi:hypothetical protein
MLRTPRASRPRASLWAAAACAAVLIGLGPFGSALPANEESPAPAIRFDVPYMPTHLAFPVVSVSRDPFVPAVAASVRTLADAETEAGAPGVLPPNAAAAGPVLRGVIVGSKPRALLEMGGKLTFVGIGTPIGNSTVLGISEKAIVLDDGETLRLPEGRP